MIGSAVEACTSATSCAEPDSDVISQDAPTACTSPPKFDDIDASQMARNIGTEKGEGGGACKTGLLWAGRHGGPAGPRVAEGGMCRAFGPR